MARAYRELEHRGIITSRAGSGFEVRGGPVEDEAARTRLEAAIEQAVAALGPKATLKLARELIDRTNAPREREGDHER